MIEPTFPKVIDNTMRKEFVACPRRFFYKYILRRVPDGKNEHLTAGGAYAKGLEVFRKLYYNTAFYPDRSDHDREELAMIEAFVAATVEYGEYEPPDQSAKSWINVVFALVNYTVEYPPAQDHLHPYNPEGDNPSVEFSFGVPIDVNHPETGEPIIYSGTFDFLAENEHGYLCGVDDKTSGSLGKNFTNKWKMESQITGYCWSAREYGYDFGGRFYVRGTSLQKTQIDYLEVPLLRTNFMLDQWHTQLKVDLLRMIDCWRHNYWDYNLGDACASFGGCHFMEVCSIPNGLEWIENDTVHNEWDPLNHGKD